jgi:hypothetical protein
MAERLGTQLQSGGLEQSIHTGLLSTGLFGGASLDLNFAATKNVGPLVSFTRASSATYIDSAGTLQTAAVDVPRFDHNPTTGESLGLLVEEQRTNLLLRSEEFDNASWNPPDPSIATVTPNAQTAPNGTLTADTFATVSGTPAIFQAVACLASTAYTWSFYVKLGTMAAADFRFAVRDDTNGAFIAADIAPSITPVTTEWRRVTYTFTTPVGCVLVRPYLYRFSPATYGTTVHLWGAQLEAGAFATSYIPTTTAAATRSADVASITGANFSSWYRQSEGTVFVNAINPALSTTLFSASDGTANNRIQADAGISARVARVVTGGITQANNTIAYTFGTQQQFALSYVLNSINFANAGTLGTEDTSATIPTVDQLRLGANPTGAGALNSTIKRLAFFPQRLSNSTLQAITQ